METRFTEEEQGQVMARALELQASAGVTLTLGDLHATATEADIDPKFVDQAVRELRSQEHVATKGLPVTTLVGSAALFFSQIYTVSGQALGSQREFYIPLAIAMALGCFHSGKRFKFGLVLFTFIALLVGLGTYAFLVLSGAEITPEFWGYFSRTGATQLILFATGALASQFGNWLLLKVESDSKSARKS